MTASDHLSGQQFYHGTKAELQPGDFINPGHMSGSSRGLPHAYASKDIDEARHFATLAPSQKPPIWDANSRRFLQPTGVGETSHIYQVEPTGRMMKDKNTPYSPNFRSTKPLKIVKHVESF